MGVRCIFSEVDARWRWRLFSFLLVCSTFALTTIEGTIICGQRLHEAHIYRGAPKGSYVMRVRAKTDLGPSPITYSLKNDGDTFELDANNGSLTTKIPIDQIFGHVYNLTVAANYGTVSQLCRVTVKVTEKNRHPPTFNSTIYRKDINYGHDPKTAILTVKAQDRSPETYNKEIYYFLREETIEDHSNMSTNIPSIPTNETDEWMYSELDPDIGVEQNHNAYYLTINKSSGEVRLKRPLDVNVGRIVATVMALNPGSPPLSNSSAVEITVHVIGAPSKVTVDSINETTARACWSPSPIGRANAFMVMYRSWSNQTVIDEASTGVTRSGSLSQCNNLTDLKPDTGYELWVFGYDGRVTGLNSRKVLFRTPKHSLCAKKPCHKSAVCTEQHGNVTCTCPLGNMGVGGEPCPCQNGGKYIGLSNKIRPICDCPPDFRGSRCHLTSFCDAHRIDDSKGVLNFNKTWSNQSAYWPCPFGPPGAQAMRRCTIEDHDHHSTWENVNDSACYNLDQFGNIFQAAQNNYTIANESFTIVSNFMETNMSDSHAANRVIQWMENFVTNSNFNQSKNITTDNVRVEVVMVSMVNDSSGRSNWNDVTFTGLDSKQFFLNESFQEHVQPTQDTSSADGHPKLTISAQAFVSFANDQNSTNIQLNYIAHKTATLFRAIDPCGNLVNDSFVDRPVFTVSLTNYNVTNLTNVVNYKIQKPKSGRWSCVYWMMNESRWSTEGMTAIQTDDTITCSANHMTSFSILFDPTPDEVIDHPQEAMSYISYVGSVLSIVGLILTIITFALFRCLNRHRSGKILLNLCLSMILLNVSFLLGAFQSDSPKDNSQVVPQPISTCNEEVNITATVLPAEENKVCMAVAVFTHYFLLTTLSWMTVEAINLYQLLIFVFGSIESHFLLKRCAVAWGVPAVIVGVTVAVNRAYYNSTSHSCMLSAFDSYVYYFTMFGPCCLLLLVNVIVFVMVTRVLCQPRRISGRIPSKVAPSGNGKLEDGVTWSQVRGAFTVMTLLGVTWVFGAFAVSGNEAVREVFQYFFCVLNSLQGFLLFVFRCVLYPEARSAWLQLFRTGTLKKHRGPAKVNNTNSNNTQPKTALHATSSDASCSTNGGYHLSSSHTNLATDQGTNPRVKKPTEFTCGYKKADGPLGEEVIYSNWTFDSNRQRMVNNNPNYPLIDLS